MEEGEGVMKEGVGGGWRKEKGCWTGGEISQDVGEIEGELNRGFEEIEGEMKSGS